MNLKKIKAIYGLRFFVVFYLLTGVVFSQNQNFTSFKKIDNLQRKANDESIDIEERFAYARKAIFFSKQSKNDSIILSSNRVLSLLFLKNGNIDSLYRINHENLKISTKLRDSLKMGYASQNIAYYFYETNVLLDSSYFYYSKARKFYNKTNQKKDEAAVLLNMATIQEVERDYIGSEINTIEAIKILDVLPKDDEIYYMLWSLHNLIGIVSELVERYDEAIDYHNKAIEYSGMIKAKNSYNAYSRYNIAILHRRKEDYLEANKQFLKILKDDRIKKEDPVTYAGLLYHLAYSRTLNNDKNIKGLEGLFRKSFEILESEEDIQEIMIASVYFSEYFLNQGSLDSAFSYAEKSYSIAKQLNANQYILNSLMLKSKIKEGEASKQYLYEHIKLNDSLVLAERSNRNKFARIDFETNEIKQENKLFEQENTRISKKNQMLIITSIGLLITLFFLYIIKTQREKNKELQLAQQQQEANEEIYNLMLSQQDKMDEARALEKQRISQELHDGILGRLFGARLSLDSLNLSKTEDAVINRGNYIKELKVIEQDIRKVSHDLNTDFIAHSGFLDIIETLVETQALAYSLQSTITADQDINWDAISNKTKIHFYRIVQESLQNIYKHAEATRVDITFKQKNNLISLAIKDDGSGFDENKAKKGIGLKNMHSRVKEIKGVLNINTKANLGTTIEIRVPN